MNKKKIYFERAWVDRDMLKKIMDREKALGIKVKLLEKEAKRDNKWIARLEKMIDSVNAHFAHPLKGNLTVGDWKDIKKFKE